MYCSLNKEESIVSTQLVIPREVEAIRVLHRYTSRLGTEANEYNTTVLRCDDWGFGSEEDHMHEQCNLLFHYFFKETNHTLH